MVMSSEMPADTPAPQSQAKAQQPDAIGLSRFDADAIKINARKVNVYYGEHYALKNVTMAIPEHSVTALIGPSGCGKSTFLRCLNRMNDLIDSAKIEGDITIGQTEVYGQSTDLVLLRKQVGMVFQKYNPFPVSIYDNVAYGPRVHGVLAKKQLDEIVEKSLRQASLWDEVKDRLKKGALSLSGGQQQRLCVARALAVEPEVLLMDEPTSALDPHATAHIEELVMQLHKEITIVMVTHNMQQAARISQNTGFFFDGELLEFGATEQIFGRPQHPKTQAYVSGQFG